MNKIAKRVLELAAALAAAVVVIGATAAPTFAAAQKVGYVYGTKTYVATVADGAVAIPPVDVYVDGYQFTGWVEDAGYFKALLGVDKCFLGSYVKVVPANCQTTYYTVRFVDGLTGAEISCQSVKRNSAAAEPGAPKHCGYHFVGWDGDFMDVTSSRTITACYKADWCYTPCASHCYDPAHWWCRSYWPLTYDSYQAAYDAEKAWEYQMGQNYNAYVEAEHAWEYQVMDQHNAWSEAEHAWEYQMGQALENATPAEQLAIINYVQSLAN